MPSRAGRMAAQDQVVTVFGCTGFFGRYVVDALCPRAPPPPPAPRCAPCLPS